VKSAPATAPGGQDSRASAFSAPPNGVIVGRVVKDVNGDGVKQADEPYLRAPGVSCGGEAVEGLIVEWSGPENGRAGLVQCFDGQPAYTTGLLPAGRYFVSLTVPRGWQLVRSTSPMTTVPGDPDPWFLVRPVTPD
jgi:hypothetical protein